jgi:hypothetical protein
MVVAVMLALIEDGASNVGCPARAKGNAHWWGRYTWDESDGHNIHLVLELMRHSREMNAFQEVFRLFPIILLSLFDHSHC